MFNVQNSLVLARLPSAKVGSRDPHRPCDGRPVRWRLRPPVTADYTTWKHYRSGDGHTLTAVGKRVRHFRSTQTCRAPCNLTGSRNLPCRQPTASDGCNPSTLISPARLILIWRTMTGMPLRCKSSPRHTSHNSHCALHPHTRNNAWPTAMWDYPPLHMLRTQNLYSIAVQSYWRNTSGRSHTYHTFPSSHDD